MTQRKRKAAQAVSDGAALPNADGRIDNVIPVSKGLVPGWSRIHEAGQMDNDPSRVIQCGRQGAAPEMQEP